MWVRTCKSPLEVFRFPFSTLPSRRLPFSKNEATQQSQGRGKWTNVCYLAIRKKHIKTAAALHLPMVPCEHVLYNFSLLSNLLQSCLGSHRRTLAGPKLVGCVDVTHVITGQASESTKFEISKVHFANKLWKQHLKFPFLGTNDPTVRQKMLTNLVIKQKKRPSDFKFIE